MTKTLTLIFFVVFTWTACRTDPAKVQKDNTLSTFIYDTTSTTVIAWDKISNYPFDSLTYTPAALAQSDIEQIEISLVESVMKYNNSLDDEHGEYKIDLKTTDYKKQLVFVTNSNGEKEVWVNCFCDDWDKSWRTLIRLVHDGGPCYFNFKLNLVTKEAYDLAVNGFA